MNNDKFITIDNCRKFGEEMSELIDLILAKKIDPLKRGLIYSFSLATVHKLERKCLAAFIEGAGRVGLADLLEKAFPDNPVVKELAKSIREYEAKK